MGGCPPIAFRRHHVQEIGFDVAATTNTTIISAAHAAALTAAALAASLAATAFSTAAFPPSSVAPTFSAAVFAAVASSGLPRRCVLRLKSAVRLAKRHRLSGWLQHARGAVHRAWPPVPRRRQLQWWDPSVRARLLAARDEPPLLWCEWHGGGGR